MKTSLPHRPCAARRRPALLLAAAASLASAGAAGAQQQTDRPPAAAPGSSAPAVDELPVAINTAEIEREIAARNPALMADSGVRVLLRVRILPDGTVDSASVRVVRPVDPAFVEPARAVARRMRFTPARAQHQPVAYVTVVPVDFAPRPRPENDGVRNGEVPPDEGTYELSAVEEWPQLRNGPTTARQLAAQYPPALRDGGVEGDVVIRFRVLEDGTVDPETVTLEQTTDLAFDQPAVAVVRQMRFTPARVGGRPVKVWATVPIHFGFMHPDPPAKADFSGTGAGARPAPNAPRP
ncbi:energy transducer TonB [Longimicrobium sp.]|uniref:energy transducer TonB n=1 Tax=Longimicrobium sp. TaxID=2029185 RepID=UPI002BCBD3C2|nr:energy transducer TonB [Longimicrobium sp.]HSU13345.1 energy transducer TonB [Longimicrobium sp.]